MSRILFVAVMSCMAVVLFSGCTLVAPVVPPQGAIYTQTKAPISTEFVNTPVSTKSGSASATSILGIIATGDCSIQAAAQAGGIKTIHHADYEFNSVLLGIYTKTTVTVYGE